MAPKGLAIQALLLGLEMDGQNPVATGYFQQGINMTNPAHNIPVIDVEIPTFQHLIFAKQRYTTDKHETEARISIGLLNNGYGIQCMTLKEPDLVTDGPYGAYSQCRMYPPSFQDSEFHIKIIEATFDHSSASLLTRKIKLAASPLQNALGFNPTAVFSQHGVTDLLQYLSAEPKLPTANIYNFARAEKLLPTCILRCANAG